MYLSSHRAGPFCALLILTLSTVAVEAAHPLHYSKALQSRSSLTRKRDPPQGSENDPEFIKLGESAEYAIDEELGKGGMGTVYKGYYKATHDSKQELAAIKISSQDTANVETVRGGTVIQHGLHDKNVLRAFSPGEFDSKGNFVTALELVDGPDIWDRVLTGVYEEAPKASNESNAMQSDYHQMVNGVAYCHNHGVFHRDIKPQNFLYDKPTGLVKLADFDTATRERRVVESICGTLPYLPPDQIRDYKDWYIPWDTEKADVYAMAISLIVMVRGFLPFALISIEPGKLSDFSEELMDRCHTDKCRYTKLKDKFRDISDPALHLLSKALAPVEDRVGMEEFTTMSLDIKEFGTGKRSFWKRDYEFAQSASAGQEICIVPPKSPDRKAIEKLRDDWKGSKATRPDILTTSNGNNGRPNVTRFL